ncbi:GntR family transcriptional regulator [Lignipirellula cremea]|uniref:Putative HTH-type transcriptional regulator YdfH n=1 Tax=Lignipirellula cremea TaxID=2528010 RepID=A0A518DLU8_9BACT|nr:GntR family transcriptional regulator [Lignipirellula cremea]QDU92816.1 putative HTH-type transcriptional regulator YdfH [Lignipirellula cremea]
MPAETPLQNVTLAPADSTAPGDRSFLQQRAYEELKRWIQETTLEPGAFLSERRLAAELGMSKTPVKAALVRLEAEGFVLVSPQQGIVVRELSVHEIADQFEIRRALETFVLRAVAGKLNAAEADRVQENLRLQEQAAASREIGQAVELDADFHAMFCEFLGNQEILSVMARLRDRMHRVISRVLEQDGERIETSRHEHQAIAAAVLQGDAERAVQAMEEHLNYGKQFLLSPRRR